MTSSDTPITVVLGSSSPARLATLRSAGVNPVVIAPEVDESAITGESAADLALALAKAKGEAVRNRISRDRLVTEPYVLFACDSLLEIEGRLYGKPGTPEAAIVRWYRMRGREARLVTGHYVAVVDEDEAIVSTRVASTEVHFADMTDNEISAYAATGEPEKVAGGFTIDGFGGPFVTRISGDPHNVVGISLPLIRQMVIDAGVSWTRLWDPELIEGRTTGTTQG